jgi:hypothetical protein
VNEPGNRNRATLCRPCAPLTCRHSLAQRPTPEWLEHFTEDPLPETPLSHP